MEYQIIIEDNPISLEKAVKKLLLDGWNPCGGISVSSQGIWAQALTKELKFRTVPY